MCDIFGEIKDSFSKVITEGHFNFDVEMKCTYEELQPYKGLVKDYRINSDSIKNRFIAVIGSDKETGHIHGSANFIFFEPSEYEKICFWKSDDSHEVLSKISLMEMLREERDIIATVGYTLTSEKSRDKYIMASTAIRLVNEILKKGVFTYIESTGRFSLKNETTSKSLIRTGTEIPVQYKDYIGTTRKESAAVDKFARVVGLKPMPFFYNIRTLGKVFVSQAI